MTTSLAIVETKFREAIANAEHAGFAVVPGLHKEVERSTMRCCALGAFLIEKSETGLLAPSMVAKLIDSDVETVCQIEAGFEGLNTYDDERRIIGQRLRLEQMAKHKDLLKDIKLLTD